jgi:hypothetical protein
MNNIEFMYNKKDLEAFQQRKPEQYSLVPGINNKMNFIPKLRENQSIDNHFRNNNGTPF